jgi:hypothetical protein
METWEAFLAAGQDALSQADWSGAKAHFEESLRYQDSPHTFQILTETARWFGVGRQR